jgi:hypothetical protein
VWVRAKTFARLDYIVVQYAKDSEANVVGIAVFGKGKMKMAVQPAMPSPTHLFAVNVLNHKTSFLKLLIFSTRMFFTFYYHKMYSVKILLFRFMGKT